MFVCFSNRHTPPGTMIETPCPRYESRGSVCVCARSFQRGNRTREERGKRNKKGIIMNTLGGSTQSGLQNQTLRLSPGEQGHLAPLYLCLCLSVSLPRLCSRSAHSPVTQDVTSLPTSLPPSNARQLLAGRFPPFLRNLSCEVTGGGEGARRKYVCLCLVSECGGFLTYYTCRVESQYILSRNENKQTPPPADPLG